MQAVASRFSDRPVYAVTEQMARALSSRLLSGADALTTLELEWRGSTRPHHSSTLSCRSIARKFSLRSRRSTWQHMSTLARAPISQRRCATGRGAENRPLQTITFYPPVHRRNHDEQRNNPEAQRIPRTTRCRRSSTWTYGLHPERFRRRPQDSLRLKAQRQMAHRDNR